MPPPPPPQANFIHIILKQRQPLFPIVWYKYLSSTKICCRIGEGEEGVLFLHDCTKVPLRNTEIQKRILQKKKKL